MQFSVEFSLYTTVFYNFLKLLLCAIDYAKTRTNKSLGGRQTQLAVKCPIVIDKGMPPLLTGTL